MTDRTLADVGTSAAAAVGVTTFTDVLDIRPARHVVVCLIDGLGSLQLDRHRGTAPRLAAMRGTPIRAVFPTTTPVGLGSFGTGLMPGAHGLVGASFLLPESGEVLVPLHWGRDPAPVAVQPEPTVFEAVARAGVTMTTVSSAAYRDSGLTRAVLRGADYLTAESVGERVDHVAAVLSSAERSFTYVYWAALDRTGHEFGVDSDRWRSALADADELVGRLVDVLPRGATLVVTADHGMVDCPPERRVQLDDNPALMADVTRIAGDPRARHVYVRPGAAADVAAAWRTELGPGVRVVRRPALMAEGLLGEVDPALAERIGDVMAICEDASVLATRGDARVSALLGQHGALSDDEVIIPALVHRNA